jgi:uncharacterized protein YdaU (DUF1376 family)
MAFYCKDYLNDTRHLSTFESGAYLHLIFSYWIDGGLPDDDLRLAKLARVTDREWKVIRPILEPFFEHGFTFHKRIDAELVKVAEISQKRQDIANKRHAKERALALANGHAIAPD